MEGSWDIFVADTNGNNRKLLMHTDDWTEGRFSPNGQWLWFEIERTVYAANADGSELHKVYVASGGLDIFEFSNDGWSMYFRDIRYDPDDPNVNNNYIIYNHRNGLIVDTGGYQVDEISSDSRWALLVKGYSTPEGWHESEEWSLVNMETGQWKNFGRFEQAWLDFSHDEQDLIVHDLYDNPAYRIYNIASESWTILNFSEEDWFKFLPDGAHMFLEEDDTLYLVNNATGERSTYLQGYRGYYAHSTHRFLFAGQMPHPDDKIIIQAYKGTEDEKLPPDIYVANGDGSDHRLIAQDAQSAMFLGDYQHVLLWREMSDNSDGEEGPYLVSIIDLRSGVEHSLPGKIYGYRLPLELSPDGIHFLWHEYQLVFDEEWNPQGIDWETYKLWVINLDTMESHQLQLELEDVNWWHRYYATFSSNGSKIVYGAIETTDDGWSLSNYATYITNLDGSGLELIGDKTLPIMFEHALGY